MKRATIAQLQREQELDRAMIRVRDSEIASLKQQLASRRDPLMEQRIQLANQLGQMIGAVSDAVKFIIGKEVL